MVTRKKAIAASRKWAYGLFVITFFAFWILYLQTPAKTSVITGIEYPQSVDLKYLMTNLTLHCNETENSDSQYLVHSSKCKIPSLSPYNPEILPYFNPKKYIRCRDKNLLTYVNKRDNVATLHIDKRFVKDYSRDGVIHCCYSAISRSEKFQISKTPDTLIDVSSCKKFVDNVTLFEDYVLVTCTNNRAREVYKNAHAVVRVKKRIEDKMKQHGIQKKNHLSVLFIGIDSISRMNLIRSLPKTHLFLKENAWVEFKGYNKIGDNTFPNLMAILTGYNESTAFKICNPRVVGPLDKCKLIWYDYRKLGFITGYGEDEAEIGTFNYMKKGFKYQPTDYYFRPYIIATEEYLKVVSIDVVKYCTGPETSGERIFNLARDFTATFKDFPNFGFFWMNSYSHNEINAVSRMDDKIVDFLKDINATNILENSIVMFISDHGFRFGSITYTHTGWLEERLPFFYMSIPQWFRNKYPNKYHNLLKNTERLTSPFDVYMTLQDILVLAKKNYTVKKSNGCPKCRSLFEEADFERSCKDAGIEQHWCTCSGYFTISPTNLIAEEAAKFILVEIRRTQMSTGGNFEQCVDFQLKKIISAGISDINYTLHKNVSYFLITFATIPEAVFQGTVSLDMKARVPTFKIEGSISRLDVYATNSWCVSDSILKKYCYCENSFKYAFSSLNVLIKRIGSMLDYV